MIYFSEVSNNLLLVFSITSVVKAYGQPLKAACAMVRLRLYDALSLIPPQYYEGSWKILKTSASHNDSVILFKSELYATSSSACR